MPEKTTDTEPLHFLAEPGSQLLSIFALLLMSLFAINPLFEPAPFGSDDVLQGLAIAVVLIMATMTGFGNIIGYGAVSFFLSLLLSFLHTEEIQQKFTAGMFWFVCCMPARWLRLARVEICNWNSTVCQWPNITNRWQFRIYDLLVMSIGFAGLALCIKTLLQNQHVQITIEMLLLTLNAQLVIVCGLGRFTARWHWIWLTIAVFSIIPYGGYQVLFRNREFLSVMSLCLSIVILQLIAYAMLRTLGFRCGCLKETVNPGASISDSQEHADEAL
jgi:hypothetical protein